MIDFLKAKAISDFLNQNSRLTMTWNGIQFSLEEVVSQVSAEEINWMRHDVGLILLCPNCKSYIQTTLKHNPGSLVDRTTCLKCGTELTTNNRITVLNPDWR